MRVEGRCKVDVCKILRRRNIDPLTHPTVSIWIHRVDRVSGKVCDVEVGYVDISGVLFDWEVFVPFGLIHSQRISCKFSHYSLPSQCRPWCPLRRHPAQQRFRAYFHCRESPWDQEAVG